QGVSGEVPCRPRGTILHVIHSGAIGGGPNAVKLLATHVNSSGWRSVVVCSDNGPLVPDLHCLGEPMIAVDLHTKGRCITGFLRLVRVIRSVRPSILHTQGQFAGFFGGLAARCRMLRSNG
ncbi:MAG: glycosyltransferase, partial [Chloroflexi bacterium]|nr:glycosyltransferase [Chloroflexota bacterium]